MAIQITGSAQNYRVGRVSGNTTTFLGLISVAVAERPTSGKNVRPGYSACAIIIICLFVNYFIWFGFESILLVLIIPRPENCLSITITRLYNILHDC